MPVKVHSSPMSTNAPQPQRVEDKELIPRTRQSRLSHSVATELWVNSVARAISVHKLRPVKHICSRLTVVLQSAEAPCHAQEADLPDHGRGRFVLPLLPGHANGFPVLAAIEYRCMAEISGTVALCSTHTPLQRARVFLLSGGMCSGT